jgi:hypothetical protein
MHLLIHAFGMNCRGDDRSPKRDVGFFSYLLEQVGAPPLLCLRLTLSAIFVIGRIMSFLWYFMSLSVMKALGVNFIIDKIMSFYVISCH